MSNFKQCWKYDLPFLRHYISSKIYNGKKGVKCRRSFGLKYCRLHYVFCFKGNERKLQYLEWLSFSCFSTKCSKKNVLRVNCSRKRHYLNGLKIETKELRGKNFIFIFILEKPTFFVWTERALHGTEPKSEVQSPKDNKRIKKLQPFISRHNNLGKI